MKTILTALLVVLASCTKELQQRPAVYFETNFEKISFPSASLMVQPFCDLKLYSISATQPGSDFLVSVVCDSLTEGIYEAGVNYWGLNAFTSPIVLNVTTFTDDVVNASFKGPGCYGSITIQSKLDGNRTMN